MTLRKERERGVSKNLKICDSFLMGRRRFSVCDVMQPAKPSLVKKWSKKMNGVPSGWHNILIGVAHC